MTTVTPTTFRLSAAALVAAVATLASGCGVAGTDFRPGVAADVNGSTITVDEVDDLTTSACSAFADQLGSNNQVVALSYLRSTLTQNLVLASAIRQFGADYDVQPGQVYRDEVQQIRSSGATLSATELHAVEVLQGSSALVSDVLGQVGSQLSVDEDGADSPAADPTADEAVQRGSTEFTAWLDDHDTVIDPQFGIELTPKGITQTDTSVSFGLSDAATSGVAATPDPETTMELPPAQRCGSYSGGLS